MMYLTNCEIFLRARDKAMYFVTYIIFFFPFKTGKK